MKIKTIDQLQQYLDDDMSWRKKELTTLFLSISSSRVHQESVYIRGAITLLYAHWEGYIKNASVAYLNYVGFIGKPYNKLKSNFVALGVQKETGASDSYHAYNSCEKITDFFSTKLSDNFNIESEKVINTKSNLNSDVLKDIFNKTGMKYTPDFELNEKRIDEKLLKYRNKIAHGEKSYNYIDLKDAFIELKELILKLLDNYRNQIINSAELKLYLD